jgi:hypothetical protein
MFKVLLDSDKRKKENEQINKEDLEEEEISNINFENEQEDELHIAISELIGILFKTH